MRLSRAALIDGRPLEKEEVKSIRRLYRAFRIAEATKPRRWWPWILSGAVVFGGVWALINLRVSTAVVELDLSVSHVEFTLPRRQLLVQTWLLTEIAASDLREIRLPRSASADAQVVTQTGDDPLSVWLGAPEGEDQAGTITIGPWTVPQDGSVALTVIGRRHYRLSVSTTPPNLTASINGRFDSRYGGQVQELEVDKPRILELLPLGETLKLDLRFAELSGVELPDYLAVDELSFLRGEIVPTDLGMTRRLRPGILAGKLYVKSLGDKEWDLRAGDSLNLAKPIGELRSLKLGDDQIGLNYYGHVEGMTLGLDHTRDVMPTLLERIYETNRLRVAWTAIFGAIAAIATLRAFLRGESS